MKLKKIIKEGIDDQYDIRFQNYIEKKYSGKNLNGWSLDVDDRSGTFYWSKKGSKHVILATPFWDGDDSLPIDVIDDETGDELLSTKLKFKPTGDMSKDEVTYLKLLKPVLQKIK